MTKKELVEAIAAKNPEMTKTKVEAFVGEVFSSMEEALKAGEKVAWPGFGIFSVSERAARKGRNPQTGAAIDIAASKTVKFKAAEALKKSM